MKYYYHRAEARGQEQLELKEYTIKEFDTLKQALEAFSKDFFLYGSSESRLISFNKQIIGKISTSKNRTKPIIEKHHLYNLKILMFPGSKSKYTGTREFLETDPEYGLQQEFFLILETNFKKACNEFLIEMEKYEDKRNFYNINILEKE